MATRFRGHIMSQTSFDSRRPALDATPYKSIMAAWAVAVILLSAGELFVSFHGRTDYSAPDAPAGQVQRASVEDALAW
jgi:hypothetical protein